MSLRWRWALTTALVAAVAVAVVAAGSGALTTRALRNEVDRDLLRRVEALDRPALRALEDRLPEGRRILRSLLGTDLAVQLLDPSGSVVFSLGQDEALPVADTDRQVASGDGGTGLRTIHVDGQPLRMVTARMGDGAVQLARDLSPTEAFVGRLVRRTALLGVAAAVAATAVGWWLAARAVRPIEELTGAAEHIARTHDLTAPIPPGGSDEVGRLSGSFAAMIAALTESRRQQHSLVSDAGHELRTPLTGLRTNLELLRRRPDLPTDVREEVVAAALAETEKLGDLVGELVDLATDARQSPEAPVESALGDLAKPVIARYATLLGRSITLSGGGAPVRVRPTQFERALGNLLDNASKWSPPGEPVEVVVADRTLAVRDRGPGIPEEDLEHVFARFYRSAAARGQPGSGLGLAIVQQAIEANGGEVFARNLPGGGAEVGFTLPARDGAPA